MSRHLEPFVRNDIIGQSKPPPSTTGILGWLWTNVFSSMANFSSIMAGLKSLLMVLLTLGTAIFLIVMAWDIIKFAFIDAVWSGTDGSFCRAGNGGKLPADATLGACWAYVKVYFSQFIYGRFPDAERWRVNVCFIVGIALMIPMLIPSVPYKKWNVIALLVAFPILTFIMLSGGYFGLSHVETSNWGGLLVTLVVAITGIVASFPIGVVLALGRRSSMPVVKLASVIFIEFWRGIPLITVLFMSSVMLPLFLPEGMDFDKLLRALICVALFTAAYMAEVIRGGLQAIPKGQYEGAMALGLPYWKMMNLIVLPQALKLVIPGIVNSFIALFKDTTLVLIIGLFDLLGQIQSSFTDPTWASPVQSATGYLFAGFIFWMFCFGMSRYSVFMENLLHTGHKR